MSIIATTATESDEDFPARTLQLADAPSKPPTEASLEPSDRQPCTVHPDWCTETGNHYDHFGTLHTVKGNDGRELLNAHLLDLSGSKPITGLGDTDTTAAEARVKATELRRFADELETLTDKVEVSASHEPSGTPQMTACPDGVSFCDGNPRDHEDPREHLHHGPLIVMGAHRPTPVSARTASWRSNCPRSTTKRPGWTSWRAATGRRSTSERSTN